MVPKFWAQSIIIDDVIFAIFGIPCLNFNCLDWFATRFRSTQQALGIVYFLIFYIMIGYKLYHTTDEQKNS